MHDKPLFRYATYKYALNSPLSELWHKQQQSICSVFQQSVIPPRLTFCTFQVVLSGQ